MVSVEMTYWYVIQQITCKNYNCDKESNKNTKMIEHNELARYRIGKK